MRERPSGFLVGGAIATSVVAVSTAAILFKVAEAPLLTAAFYRLLFATLILVPFLVWRHMGELRALTARDWWLLAGVGVILGVHFGAWVPSLGLTSVASSVFLVTIHPVFVGLWAHFADREGPGALGWIGIVVALAGGAYIAYSDASLAGERLLGDALAVVGAIAAAAYFIAGRRLRQRLSLLPYVTPVYAVASVTLLAFALAFEAPVVGIAAPDYGLFFLLALVPMILGHTLINWSLKYVRASVVATTILGEPLGSTLLAYVLLSELPPAGALQGGVLVLIGIALVVRDDARQRSARAAMPSVDVAAGAPVVNREDTKTR